MKRIVTILILLAFALVIGLFTARYFDANSESGRFPPGIPLEGDNGPTADKGTKRPNASAMRFWKGRRDPAIDFWGKVVDQADNPIPGARVRIRIRSWPFLRSTIFKSAKFEDRNYVTDANGEFQVTGEHGDSFTVKSLEKEGYTHSKHALRSFSYRSAPGDISNPENPAVFRMLKSGLAVAEKLIPFDFSGAIPADGSPVSLNVMSGRKYVGEVTDADIRLSFERTPQEIPVGRSKFSWTARIEILNGGLIVRRDDLKSFGEEDLVMMYKAPDSGYTPFMEFHMSPSDPEWRDPVNVSFFFQSRDGECFGRAAIHLWASYSQDKAAFMVRGDVNPTGSPNLQR